MFEYDRDLIRHQHLVPNTVQIPNFLIDVVMPIIGNPSTKVMLFLARKIYGWGKEKDKISLSQIVKGTGLNEKQVIRALDELQENKIIIKIKKQTVSGGYMPNEYAFNERFPGLKVPTFFREKREIKKK